MYGYILQQTVNGIQLGTIYALIALGYTMVYGIIRLINFAHADIFMVGAYVAFFAVAFYTGTSGTFPPQITLWVALICGYLVFVKLCGKVPALARAQHALGRRSRFGGRLGARALASTLGALLATSGTAVCAAAVFPVLHFGTRTVFRLPLGPFLFPVVLVYVMAVCGFFGMAMERIAYRPLRYKPRLSALITALGVSLFLENFCSLDMVFANSYRAFPEIVVKRALVHVPGTGVALTNVFFLNLAVLAVMLAGLWFLVEKTLVGKQMRAVAFDKMAASLMGIDVDRIIAVTFMIGPALAGVSGTLYAMNYGVLQSPFLGFFPGLKAFIAAVLGGIGSLPGAVIGAFIMGISEVFANSVDSNLGFAAAFVILIAILLVRPNGILGKREVEKV